MLNFTAEQRAALLLYSAPTIDKYEQDVHISLIGKIPEYMNHPPYEKTKAQRILAKGIPSSNVHQQTENNTITSNSSSSSNRVINNTEHTISVRSIIFYKNRKKDFIFVLSSRLILLFQKYQNLKIYLQINHLYLSKYHQQIIQNPL